MNRRRRGFTLIELLVVIAIIAILVAMLLPAVQQVREAARKSQCQDHLHNIVIGLHDYEISFSIFPPGNIGQVIRDKRQPNWLVHLLPFVEQKQAYDQFDIEGGNLSGQGSPPLLTANQNIMAQLRVDLYNCPSSPLDLTEPITGGTGAVQLVNYVGIAGSAINGADLTSQTNPADTTHGINSYAGVLISANSRGKMVRMADIVDGTSNVFAVTEQGDFINGTADIRACKHVNGSWSSGPTSPQLNDVWTQSITTYRHPINSQSTSLPGADQPYRANTIINSAHPGGAQFCAADGVVTFISENIDHNTMIRLCDRRDRQPVSY